MDKYLSEYIGTSLRCVPVERHYRTPLKQIFRDYQAFCERLQIYPLRYTNFYMRISPVYS